MDMNNIVFLILFIFPGVFIRMIYNRFFPILDQEESKYFEIVHAFVISTFVLLINFGLMEIYYKFCISSWSNFTKIISNNPLLFLGFTIISGSIVLFCYHQVIYKLNPFISNKFIRKPNNLAQETEFPSPWHDVFENPNFSLNDRVVGIFKGKELITIGYLGNYSSPSVKEKEFKIIYSDWFMKQYLKDESAEKKVFDKIDAEYYDITNDVLIKFYNSDKINKKMELK